MRANEQAYGALSDVLKDIGNDYRGDYKRLTNRYGRGISNLGSMLNVGGNPVTAGAFGGVAASGLRGLGQHQARGIEATRSARTQAGLQQKNNALNLLAAFRDQMRELNHNRQDIAAQEKANIASLTPQYRDQIQAEREEDELANWYRDYLSGQVGGGGGGQQNQRQINQVQASTNFQMADAGASSQAQVPVAAPVPRPQPMAPAPPAGMAAFSQMGAPIVPQPQPQDQVMGQRISGHQVPGPTPGGGMRDPFTPPPGYGAQPAPSPAPAPGNPPPGSPMADPSTQTPGRGYWYTDPMTGEKMFSNTANSPLGEIRYWERVLPSVQHDPVLLQMVTGHIADLRQVAGAR